MTANTKKSILIVEDEESQAKALEFKLTQEGFAVLMAKDGEEGLKLALENHPDLILLDIILPKMDGMTMMKKLRHESTWGKEVPIILLTNLTADDDQRMKDVAETEPAFYLVKSNWKIQEVVEKIAQRLAGLHG